MYGTTRANDGYRARLGVIIPSVNTVVEAWFPRVVPEGVTVHVARMPIVADGGTDALEDMMKHEVAAAKLVADCAPDVILYACTASTLVRGRKFDLSLMASIEREAGVACVTTTDCLVRALSTVSAKRICIISPYVKVVDELEARFFEECGFEIMGSTGLGIENMHELADPSPGEIYRFARDSWVPGSDALVISCLAFRSHFVAEALERDIGVPVITSSTATLWGGLRRAGVHEAIPGYGRILTT